MDGMLGLIRRQSQAALATADILLVIMDGRAGLTPLDQEIVNGLHGVDKPTFWVVNKIDTPKSEPLLADFHASRQGQAVPGLGGTRQRGG